MKKLFLMVCAVSTLTALAAEDSYLYWMVEDSITVLDAQGGAVDFSWDKVTAKVVAYDASTWRPGESGTLLSLYAQNQSGGGLVAVNGVNVVSLTGDNSPYYAGIGANVRGDSGAWSYFIELYNDNTFFARSLEGLDYVTARGADYLMGSDLKPGAGLWSVSQFTTVPAPEPNSAILLLIGCAALALRRRKQIAA